jgi:hypothetical protein
MWCDDVNAVLIVKIWRIFKIWEMINWQPIELSDNPQAWAHHLYATSESVHRKEKKVVQPGTTKSCCSNNTTLFFYSVFFILYWWGQSPNKNNNYNTTDQMRGVNPKISVWVNSLILIVYSDFDKEYVFIWFFCKKKIIISVWFWWPIEEIWICRNSIQPSIYMHILFRITFLMHIL